ncbi:threonine-phosphate decarboxylase CobD [Marinospirillum perlucidum]|uniref:threonine-phosphate decarboxylase CobD n=1 Tax=Marinospirillum perlucidum TaxID=1982602 RepID=UPI001FE450B7|nr:threonine-phosphate decarboxylase CobD [Marinospirillum perlucidum]
MLEHGGQLKAAARLWGRPEDQWLDLSTGINPWNWPVPPLPADVWQRLPEQEDGLESAQTAYYQSTQGLALPGSQAAIPLLPQLLFAYQERAKIGVALLDPAYREHWQAWQQAGYLCHPVAADRIDDWLLQNPTTRVLLLVHPNNPTGAVFDSRDLYRWLSLLQERDGYLIVDEAFMDATPQQSLLQETLPEGLVVLRSLGKFFGLAGLRLGFVFARPWLLQKMAQHLGPWAVSHPARYLGKLALQDQHWQEVTRVRLHLASQQLSELLTQAGLPPAGGTALFQWTPTPEAGQLAEFMAERGLLVRFFAETVSLRWGLPGSPEAWQRLETALNEWRTRR